MANYYYFKGGLDNANNIYAMFLQFNKNNITTKHLYFYALAEFPIA